MLLDLYSYYVDDVTEEVFLAGVHIVIVSFVIRSCTLISTLCSASHYGTRTERRFAETLLMSLRLLLSLSPCISWFVNGFPSTITRAVNLEPNIFSMC